MRYAKIKKHDIANGPGVRLSLFVQGCSIHCKGCFNPETWDFNGGVPFTDKEINDILLEVEKPEYQGLSILGGDPFCQKPEDIEILCDLCKKVHSIGKDVWVWTGKRLEDVRQDYKDFLKNIDCLVDGPFIEERKTLGGFRGSSNQRITQFF